MQTGKLSVWVIFMRAVPPSGTHFVAILGTLNPIAVLTTKQTDDIRCSIDDGGE